MKERELSVSFIVLSGLLVLFFLFLILEPTPSGYISLSSDVAGLSLPSLIIMFIILVLILGAGFFIYRKVKKKKLPKAPAKPTEEANDAELETLFAETKKPELPKVHPKHEPEPKVKPMIKRPQVRTRDPAELQKFIQDHHQKGTATGEIYRQAEQQGWSKNQIAQVISQINQQTLHMFIQQALHAGYSSEKIRQDLLNHGWSEEIVNQALA